MTNASFDVNSSLSEKFWQQDIQTLRQCPYRVLCISVRRLPQIWPEQQLHSNFAFLLSEPHTSSAFNCTFYNMHIPRKNDTCKLQQSVAMYGTWNHCTTIRKNKSTDTRKDKKKTKAKTNKQTNKRTGEGYQKLIRKQWSSIPGFDFLGLIYIMEESQHIFFTLNIIEWEFKIAKVRQQPEVL